MIKVEIDPHARIRDGHLTYAGFEEAEGGTPEVGDTVLVYESQSGLATWALVADVNDSAQVMFLDVDWDRFWQSRTAMLGVLTPMNAFTGQWIVSSSTMGPQTRARRYEPAATERLSDTAYSNA